MIVVIGTLRLRGAGGDSEVVGLAASIASFAAADGALVEIITRLGDDPAGDAVGLALTRRHIGHVAILRDPVAPTVVVDVGPEDGDPGAGEMSTSTRDDLGPQLEAADVNLALRYLPQLSVIVVVHAADDIVGEAIEASTWADTSLIVVVRPGRDVPDGLPVAAVVLEVEDADESAAGAAIGRFGAALDRGDSASDAYQALIASVPV
jgi:hypothetical protein